MGGNNSKDQESLTPSANCGSGAKTKCSRDVTKVDHDLFITVENKSEGSQLPQSLLSDYKHPYHKPAVKHGWMDSDLFFTLYNPHGECDKDVHLEAEVQSSAGRKLREMGFSRMEIKDAIAYLKKTLGPGYHKKSMDEMIAMIMDRRETKETTIFDKDTQPRVDRHLKLGFERRTQENVPEVFAASEIDKREENERCKLALSAAESRLRMQKMGSGSMVLTDTGLQQKTYDVTRAVSAMEGRSKAPEKETQDGMVLTATGLRQKTRDVTRAVSAMEGRCKAPEKEMNKKDVVLTVEEYRKQKNERQKLTLSETQERINSHMTKLSASAAIRRLKALEAEREKLEASAVTEKHKRKEEEIQVLEKERDKMTVFMDTGRQNIKEQAAKKRLNATASGQYEKLNSAATFNQKPQEKLDSAPGFNQKPQEKLDSAPRFNQKPQESGMNIMEVSTALEGVPTYGREQQKLPLSVTELRPKEQKTANDRMLISAAKQDKDGKGEVSISKTRVYQKEVEKGMDEILAKRLSRKAEESSAVSISKTRVHQKEVEKRMDEILAKRLSRKAEESSAEHSLFSAAEIRLRDEIENNLMSVSRNKYKALDKEQGDRHKANDREEGKLFLTVHGRLEERKNRNENMTLSGGVKQNIQEKGSDKIRLTKADSEVELTEGRKEKMAFLETDVRLKAKDLIIEKRAIHLPEETTHKVQNREEGKHTLATSPVQRQALLSRKNRDSISEAEVYHKGLGNRKDVVPLTVSEVNYKEQGNRKDVAPKSVAEVYYKRQGDRKDEAPTSIADVNHKGQGNREDVAPVSVALVNHKGQWNRKDVAPLSVAEVNHNGQGNGKDVASISVAVVNYKGQGNRKDVAPISGAVVNDKAKEKEKGTLTVSSGMKQVAQDRRPATATSSQNQCNANLAGVKKSKETQGCGGINSQSGFSNKLISDEKKLVMQPDTSMDLRCRQLKDKMFQDIPPPKYKTIIEDSKLAQSSDSAKTELKSPTRILHSNPTVEGKSSFHLDPPLQSRKTTIKHKVDDRRESLKQSNPKTTEIAKTSCSKLDFVNVGLQGEDLSKNGTRKYVQLNKAGKVKDLTGTVKKVNAEVKEDTRKTNVIPSGKSNNESTDAKKNQLEKVSTSHSKTISKSKKTEKSVPLVKSVSSEVSAESDREQYETRMEKVDDWTRLDGFIAKESDKNNLGKVENTSSGNAQKGTNEEIRKITLSKQTLNSEYLTSGRENQPGNRADSRSKTSPDSQSASSFSVNSSDLINIEPNKDLATNHHTKHTPEKNGTGKNTKVTQENVRKAQIPLVKPKGKEFCTQKTSSLPTCSIVVGKKSENTMQNSKVDEKQRLSEGDHPISCEMKESLPTRILHKRDSNTMITEIDDNKGKANEKASEQSNVKGTSKTSCTKKETKQNTECKSSVSKMSKKKETIVYIKLWTLIKCEDDVIHSFVGIIADVPFKIDKLTFNEEENWTKLDIKFQSVNMSRTFCTQLKRNKDNFGIHFEILTSAPRKKDMKMVEDQLESMCSRSAKLLQRHISLEKLEEEKLTTLKESKGSKEKKAKFVSIEKFKQRELQITALTDKIEEYKGQRNEFQIRLLEITQKLKALKHGEYMKESLRDVMKDFNIECSRLEASLPMYAKRTDIVELIKENQVSIILGETGSGKSTQLTQYVHQANMANGLIVCTQPRKVAAISLASRVAQEMNDNVGHLVGYHVGMKSKKNPQTKILYMTDHLLLNECLEDNLLLKYSCIIIDEAHERSIYTDLLLGMIKSILPLRDDLRVVVTSATINPEVFVEYFGYAPVLKVSGRTFPVSVEWCPSNYNDIDDYEDRAVRKALEVHNTSSPGDILVFLTSQLEIERSIDKMEAYLKGRRDAIIMPLHGKLQADEQGRVFNTTPKGKRKIVFATNIAETSLTIPGVKYVIDTGFAKEMTFDPNRNLSSLDVSYISKSSAEQRKGRAGRTDVGKCYRLYSFETFNDMKEIAAPEILKIHLGHAILKLLQLDVNPLEFDFVEAPSKAFLDSAYETLQHLECVTDGKITPKGKWIAKLPLSPNLGSLVYDAVESESTHKTGIAIEGVVLAACCTTGSSLFYRAGSIEQKREADKLKVPFCHSAGDHLTYLNVYRQWHKVDEKKKGRWCRDNSVNGKAMRGVRETVNEILQTLKKELGVSLHFSLPQTPSNDNVLQTFIFKAFMANVCYFLGHQKAGYHFIDKNQRVTVHPSSAIESLGSLPTWVVLERVMKTSKEFALNITVVKEEDVEDALSRGHVTFDLDAVKKQRVEEVCVEFVGSQLHREFVGTRYKNVKKMEEDLSSERNDIFIVEADRSKGVVSVFSTITNKLLSESVLKESICPLREKIRLETVEIPLSDSCMNILATIGPGGVTLDISAPNEFKTILVYSAADEMFDVDEIRQLFERRFGEVREVCTKSPHSENNEFWGKVTFVKPDAAAAAVAELKEKGSEIWTRPTLKISREQNSFRATISWCRRKGKGFGFVQIHDASLLSTLCNKREIRVATSLARVTRSKKSMDEVHIAGFHELVDEGVLRESVMNALQALEDDIGKVVVIREKVQTSSDMMQIFKRRLKVKIESYANPGSFRINLIQPNDGHTTYRGSVTFDDPDVGNLVCQEMDHKFMMNNQVISMVPNLEANVHVKARVYKMVERDLTKVIKSAEEKEGMHVKQKRLRNNDFVIDIHSSDINELARIKSRFEKILRGDTLEYELRNLDKILYSRQGREELQKIMKDTNTEIILDDRNLAINFYGQPSNRQNAMRRVCLYLDRIKHSYCQIIELRGQDKPVGYMKAIIVKYGADLDSLKTEFELNSVELNHRLHKLTLLGEEDNVHRCVEAVKIIGEHLNNSLGKQVTDPECGICFCEVDSNELYRLESCGHPYCEGCVKGQVESLVNSRDFPLKCTFQNCENLWAWQDVMSMVKKGFISKKVVVTSSVSSFVGSHKDTYRFCLTPDCPLVYKVSNDGKIFKCPECDIRICTSCHVESHTGLSCAMYKASNGDDEDGVFQWMMKDPKNRKLCPCCSQCIEKNQGCQHMECTMCHMHICWICMATFTSSGECYGHLRKSHGTFM